jgi:hypothetical protein
MTIWFRNPSILPVWKDYDEKEIDPKTWFLILMAI